MKKTGLVMTLVLLCVVGILAGCISGPIPYLGVILFMGAVYDPQ